MFRLEKEYQESIHLRDSLKRAMGFEKLGMDPAQLAALSKAAAQLEDAAKEQDRLEEELRELKNGTLMSELTAKQAELQ